MELSQVYCVDRKGRLFVRCVFLHDDDQTYYSHPLKKVNPLGKWRFSSTDKNAALDASRLIKLHLAREETLDQQLEALSDHS